MTLGATQSALSQEKESWKRWLIGDAPGGRSSILTICLEFVLPVYKLFIQFVSD
jgi:hypothetical protein